MDKAKEICSALFVDFDNIYSGLEKTTDAKTVDTFAMQPDVWLKWLEDGLSTVHYGEDKYKRRILIRKCYMNPARYWKYRPHFTRAAFEVVDCPQLTSEGKTSTDIHMVMDIMDSLQPPNQFDEFILFSADADFTPVLLRIRKYNRRSVVVAVGFISPAYKSACDFLLPPDVLYKEALNMGDEEDEVVSIVPSITPTNGKALDQLAEAVLKVISSNGTVTPNELPSIYKQVPVFRESHSWLDYFSLEKLTKAVVARKQTLVFVKDTYENDWYVKYQPAEKLPSADLVKPGKSESQAEKKQLNDVSIEDLKEKIAKLIIENVRKSPAPVKMAALADLVKTKFSSYFNGNGWLGLPSFKGLLEELDLDNLKIIGTIPGFVYDPAKHDPSTTSAVEHKFKTLYPEIEPIVKEVHQLTDMPYLLPEHYHLLFSQLARTVNEMPFHITRTTRLVRDRCVERGVPVARAHVNFIVNGIQITGHQLGKEVETPANLAECSYQNTLNLCQVAQMVLDQQQKDAIHDWLCSDLSTPS